MDVYVPPRMADFYKLPVRLGLEVCITFVSSHVIPRCLGTFDGVDIAICGDADAYKENMRRNGTSALFEQKATLLHELLHLYNMILRNRYEERYNVVLPYEDLIDETAYKLLRRDPAAVDRLVCAMTRGSHYYFQYDHKKRNPFYLYHMTLCLRHLDIGMPSSGIRTIHYQ